MSSMEMVSLPAAAMMAVGMMVAMMLPSFAPAPVRYHRALRAAHAPHTFARTVLFAASYIVVWAAVGLLLFFIDRQASRMSAPLLGQPGVVAATLIAAGALQQTAWKGSASLVVASSVSTSKEQRVRCSRTARAVGAWLSTAF